MFRQTNDARITRRRMLQVTAAGAVTAIAGCGGNGTTPTTSGSEPPLPEYATWIGSEDIPEPDSDESVGFIRTDFDGLSQLNTPSSGDSSDFGSSLPNPEQQFISTPVYATAAFMMVMGLGLMPYGNVSQKALENIQNMDSSQTTTTTTTGPTQETTDGVFVGDSIVLLGNYDTDALVSELTGFEEETQRNGFTIYLGVESEESFGDMVGYAFAVSDSAVVFYTPGTDSDAETTTTSPDEKKQEALERITYRVDVAGGAVDQAVDVSDSLDHALRVAGDEMFAFGGVRAEGFTPTTESDAGGTTTETSTGLEFDEINSVTEAGDVMVMGTTMTSNTSVDSVMSVHYPSSDDVPDRSTFEQFVANANDSSITIDGQVVDVTGTWSGLKQTTTPTTTSS